jgi:hypothetical protein
VSVVVAVAMLIVLEWSDLECCAGMPAGWLARLKISANPHELGPAAV